MMEYCKVCHAEVLPGSKFCIKCGTALDTQQDAAKSVNGQEIRFNGAGKKKNKAKLIGILASIISVIIIAAVIIVILVLGRNKKIDVSRYFSVDFEGYDTIGTAYLEADTDRMINDILEAVGEDKKEIGPSLSTLINSFSYEISDTEGLSNGDTIELVFTYDNTMADECKLGFKNTVITYTVKNLKKVTKVNPFEYVTVSFSGNSGEGNAVYEKGLSLDFLENKDFYIDKNSKLRNGDIVTLYLDDSAVEEAINKGYKLTATSQEYTVEGLKEYCESLLNISDENMAVIREAAVEKINQRYEELASYAKLFDLEYVGTYFAQNKNSVSDNYVIVIHKGRITSPNKDYDTQYIYLPVKVTNLLVKNDKLSQIKSYDLGKINVADKAYTLFGYLSGAEMYYNEIEMAVNENKFEATQKMPDFKAEMNEALSIENMVPEEVDSDIYTLITDYMKVLYITSDKDALSLIVDDVSNMDKYIENWKWLNKYIEGFDNIKCYKFEATKANTYVVCVTYDTKFVNIVTSAPAGVAYIVKYDETSEKYLIHNMKDGESIEDYMSVFEIEKVNVLSSDVNQRYEKALSSDDDLRKVMDILTNN